MFHKRLFKSAATNTLSTQRFCPGGQRSDLNEENKTRKGKIGLFIMRITCSDMNLILTPGVNVSTLQHVMTDSLERDDDTR